MHQYFISFRSRLKHLQEAEMKKLEPDERDRKKDDAAGTDPEASLSLQYMKLEVEHYIKYRPLAMYSQHEVNKLTTQSYAQGREDGANEADEDEEADEDDGGDSGSVG